MRLRRRTAVASIGPRRRNFPLRHLRATLHSLAPAGCLIVWLKLSLEAFALQELRNWAIISRTLDQKPSTSSPAAISLLSFESMLRRFLMFDPACSR